MILPDPEAVRQELVSAKAEWEAAWAEGKKYNFEVVQDSEIADAKRRVDDIASNLVQLDDPLFHKRKKQLGISKLRCTFDAYLASRGLNGFLLPC